MATVVGNPGQVDVVPFRFSQENRQAFVNGEHALVNAGAAQVHHYLEQNGINQANPLGNEIHTAVDQSAQRLRDAANPSLDTSEACIDRSQRAGKESLERSTEAIESCREAADRSWNATCIIL